MSKRIQTYDDLLKEKERMEKLLAAQKELVQLDLRQFRSEMRPAFRAVKTIGKLFTRDKDRSLLGIGTERAIDFIFKRVVLNKAGWLAKFVVPILVKNFSSHIVAENKQSWIQKLRSWMSRKNHNGQTPPAPDPAATNPTTNKE